MAGFTAEQLQQINATVRNAVREELADAGLRLDGPDNQDEAKEDFRFLRRWRRSYEGAASKIGGAILLSILAIGGTIFGMGFWQWISRHLP